MSNLGYKSEKLPSDSDLQRIFYILLKNVKMKLFSGLIGLCLAKSVPPGQSADQDVESLEGIFDEMEINEKLHLDLFEGDILGRFSWMQSATYRVI